MIVSIKHIPEGAEARDLSDSFLSFGRIYSAPEIREKYLSVRLLGRRFFMAWGAYAYFARRDRSSVRFHWMTYA